MPAPPLPRSVVTARRDEIDRVRLVVLDGALPDALRGHYFTVAPVSTVAWGGRPRAGQPSLLNGDGLVCRLDFDGAEVHAISRLMRTPDFVADERTHGDAKLLPFRFFDAGIARLSFSLGARNFLNTAFVPIVTPGEPPRLLVTYDAGRPYEIDPVSLEVATPVGATREWRAETFANAPFPMILSPGHPQYDPARRELYSVCYGRSLDKLLASVRLAKLAARLPAPLRDLLHLEERLMRRLGVEHFFMGLLEKLERRLGDLPQTFTELVRWDTSGALTRHPLKLADGRDVEITQSVHQVALTTSFVVLLDTNFRVGFEQWFNDPAPRERSLEELARAIVTRPQRPETILYIIRRRDVEAARASQPVRATRVALPVESGHLLADFDDDGRHVTVHLAHSAATDLAEWIRPYDANQYSGEPPPEWLHGMLATGAMDRSRLGRYRIDVDRGAVVDARTASDDLRTWTVGLYAARGVPAIDAIPPKLSQLYWTTEGFFPELLTRFVHDLYARYPHRLASLAEIERLGEEGRPSCLLRLDTSTMTLVDAHVLPASHIMSSPQFIPSPTAAGETDGWLAGIVFTPARAELWLYDAAALSRGPIARLDLSALGIGFSIHACWLDTIAPRTSAYQVTLDDTLAAPLPPGISLRSL